MSALIINDMGTKQEILNSRESFDKVMYDLLIQNPTSIVIKNLSKAQRHRLHTFYRKNADMVSLGNPNNEYRDMKFIWDKSYEIELANKFEIKINYNIQSPIDTLKQKIYHDIIKHLDEYFDNI